MVFFYGVCGFILDVDSYHLDFILYLSHEAQQLGEHSMAHSHNKVWGIVFKQPHI